MKKTFSILLLFLLFFCFCALFSCSSNENSETNDNENKKTCNIVFSNFDGTILQQSVFEEGDIPEYKGKMPLRDSSVSTTYTFVGWDKEITKVCKDETYIATFKEEVRKYNVIFDVNGGDNLIENMSIEYNSTISKFDNPTRISYDFLGWYLDGKKWDFDSDVVTKDITLKAEWSLKSGEIEYYIEIHRANGSIDDRIYFTERNKQTFLVGKINLTKDTAQYKYSWQEELPDDILAQNYVFHEIRTLQKYTIKFVNYNDIVLQTMQLKYGEMPAYTEETPTRENNGTTRYEFIGWNNEIAIVTGDVTYKAVYKSSSETERDKFN